MEEFFKNHKCDGNVEAKHAHECLTSCAALYMIGAKGSKASPAFP